MWLTDGVVDPIEKCRADALLRFHVHLYWIQDNTKAEKCTPKYYLVLDFT